MKRGVKIFWIVAAVVVAVGVAAFISADVIVSRVAHREVNKLLATLPFDSASVGAVHIRLFGGVAQVDDVQLAYRGTPVSERDTTRPGVAIRVERIFLGRLFYSLLLNRQVLLSNLIIDRPQLELWMDEEHPERCFPEFPKDTTPFTNPLRSAELMNLSIRNADMRLHSLSSKLDLAVDSLSLSVNDLRYDSVFTYCDSVYSLSLAHAAVLLPDGRMRLETNGLSQSDQGPLCLGRTRIANTMPCLRLADLVREPVTWIDMTIASVETSPFNPLRKVLAKDYTLESAKVDVAFMDIFRDERYAPKETFQTPQEILTAMPVVFRLGHVDATVLAIDIRFAITEKNIGKLQLGKIRAQVDNITNRSDQTMTAKGRAPLSGGKVNAEMKMTMNKSSRFSLSMHGEGVDAALLNPFVRPLVGITFNCFVDTLDTQYEGDNVRATGTFRLLYHGLHVLAHKGDDVPFKIVTKHANTITTLGNSLIPHSNPTAVDVRPRAYNIDWKRDEWKPYYLYLFGPCIDGVIETMLPGLFVHRQIKPVKQPKTNKAAKS